MLKKLKTNYFPDDKWFELGLALDLCEPDLTTISSNNKEASVCLRICLSSWLKKQDEARDDVSTLVSTPRTVLSLVNALKHDLQLVDVAECIQQISE